jgi:hypothetical protein
MTTRAATTNSTTTILALDLGKFRSVACAFEPVAGTHQFQTIATTPAAVHDLLVAQAPATLVIEACSVSGWISDLADTLGIAVRVANTNGEAWKWRRVKRKTDRDDALKLVRLHASDQLPIVHVPKLAVRQHRALIKYRHGLVDRRWWAARAAGRRRRSPSWRRSRGRWRSVRRTSSGVVSWRWSCRCSSSCRG